MSLAELINTYGYPMIFLGAFLEGETVLVLGGVAAKLGHLELPWVIVSAFSATLISDQVLFFLGRYKGTVVLSRLPSWQRQSVRVLRYLEKHRYLIVLGFRFFYGMRTITPFVIGMSRIPVGLFLVLNVISALTWATLISGLGYLIGNGLERILIDIQRYEIEVLAIVAITGLLFWLVTRLHK